MPLKPGLVPTSDYTNSMAEAMEDALRMHWPSVLPHYPTIPFDDRFLKLFFVAISQGVVRHLEENPFSFEVKVDEHVEGVVAEGNVDFIETENVVPPAVVSDR